jgi:methylated-DNA-[protein]-cysteine S-methyltransferase
VFDVVVGFPKMKVAVKIRGERVVEVRYLPAHTLLVHPESQLAERAAQQLERYREDPATRFDLPLAIEGTPFQRRLWDALCEIPCGKTLTYGELARRLRAPARAIGQACGDNRLPIVIPCHRVVASSGIGGFAHTRRGYLIEAKQWLLAHEAGAPAFELTP